MTIGNMKLNIPTEGLRYANGYTVVLNDEADNVRITVFVKDNDPECDLRATAIAEVIQEYMNNRDKFIRRK